MISDFDNLLEAFKLIMIVKKTYNVGKKNNTNSLTLETYIHHTLGQF